MQRRLSLCAALLTCALNSDAQPLATHDDNGSLCELVKRRLAYANSDVSFGAVAEAALHEFDVALTDPSCPERNIFLSADRRFIADPVFVWMMKQLYPDFPEDSGYTAAKVPIRVTGSIVIQDNRGLKMIYLRLRTIERSN